MGKIISIIAAVSDNWAIGRGGDMPWHLSEDLRYFKKVTSGNTVIMGRKTFDSIGKPLPNRRNFVISSSIKEEEKITGVFYFKTAEDAIEAAQPGEEKLFIIGGAASMPR